MCTRIFDDTLSSLSRVNWWKIIDKNNLCYIVRILSNIQIKWIPKKHSNQANRTKKISMSQDFTKHKEQRQSKFIDPIIQHIIA